VSEVEKLSQFQEDVIRLIKEDPEVRELFTEALKEPVPEKTN